MNVEDKFIKVVVDLQNEAEEVKLRFGEGNKIYKKILNRIKVLVEFYDEQEPERNLLTLLKANYVASQMIRYKSKKMSYEEQAKNLNWDTDKWRQMDNWDEEIKELTKLLNEPS